MHHSPYPFPHALTVKTFSLFGALLLAGPWGLAADTKPTYKNAGLRNPDGSPHLMPSPHPVTGKTLDVTQFGAKVADDDSDDRPAIEAALSAASEGDEIYFPDGVYNLVTGSERDPLTHLFLKTGVNLRGQSQTKTILKSSFDGVTPEKSFTMLKGTGVHDLEVSKITFTSTWNRNFSDGHRAANPDRGGPSVCLSLDGGGKAFNYNIHFTELTVERYSKMGIHLSKGSHDVTVRRCLARNATDLGGGGSGYGFVIQAGGHKNATENPYLGTARDSYFNLIEQCHAQGPYIRHGYLVQFWAHHCAVISNTAEKTAIDAIDLHGEDEYLIEIAFNTLSGTSKGSGIGIGNSGAGHDKTGPLNWIHHNTLQGCFRGITAEYGTSANVIEDNTITGNSTIPNGWGIGLGSIKNFLVRRNLVTDNNAQGFRGIVLFHNAAEGDEAAGAPLGCLIEGNRIENNRGAKALAIESDGGDNQWVSNAAKGNEENGLP